MMTQAGNVSTPLSSNDKDSNLVKPFILSGISDKLLHRSTIFLLVRKYFIGVSHKPKCHIAWESESLSVYIIRCNHGIVNKSRRDVGLHAR